VSYAFQWLRSLLFNIQMYVVMVFWALAFVPLSLYDRTWSYTCVGSYCRYVRWSASWIIGLRSEVRGVVPTGEVLIASKHQSFFDILMLVSVLPQPKFIMKKELKYVPIIGFYGERTGSVPVDRGKKGAAISQMKKDVQDGLNLPGQLVIFPQGTRVAPGAKRSYKVGTAILYEQLEQPCIPVACNVGVFWPKHAVLRKPGLAVIEFLPAIAPGESQTDLMARLEDEIEDRSNALSREAGFEIED